MEFDIEKAFISNRELGEILKYCGFTKTDFTNHLEKSPAFYHNCLMTKRMIPIKYVESLIDMISPEIFTYALEHIREKMQLNQEYYYKKQQISQLEKRKSILEKEINILELEKMNKKREKE